MARPCVFLDSSVIITALISSQGGSFYILTHYGGKVRFLASEYVLAEVNRVLRDKFQDRGELRTKLFLLLGLARVAVLVNPPKRAVTLLSKFISPGDAPILASALHDSDYLLTLDNDFFTSRVKNVADHKGLIILKPKEFIELFE